MSAVYRKDRCGGQVWDVPTHAVTTAELVDHPPTLAFPRSCSALIHRNWAKRFGKKLSQRLKDTVLFDFTHSTPTQLLRFHATRLYRRGAIPPEALCKKYTRPGSRPSEQGNTNTRNLMRHSLLRYDPGGHESSLTRGANTISTNRPYGEATS